MAAGFATVKAVPTGDTLVLMGRASGGPPPEIQLSLSSVLAPRLARGPNATVDEPLAWEARDYLRKLCLGKTVQFRQDANSKGGRAYGTVWLPSQTPGGPAESVALSCVRAGWCVTQQQRGEVEAGSALAELQAAEFEAKEARRGQHGVDGAAKARSVRDVKWNADAGTYFAKYKNGRVKALVEYVKDGSNLRCLLLPDHAVVSVSLAGVRCGRVNRAALSENAQGGKENSTGQPKGGAAADAEDGTATPVAGSQLPQRAEPYAEEARFFVETRLLHREVELKFAQLDRYGNALCVVSHSAGQIARELLKEGFGKISEPGLLGVESGEAAALRDAEKTAKRAQKRLWRGYAPPQVAGVEKEFDAYVVEVVSGDQVAVMRSGDETNGELRLQLSSIKAPRLGNQRQGRQGEAFCDEAKEYLRKVSIGKRVRVRVEYAKDPAPIDGSDKPGPGPKRVFASVALSHSASTKTPGQIARRDLAELVVAEGLAVTVTPRNTDERAERFDALAAAEKEAKTAKRGLHSGKASPPPSKTQDLAGDAKRARAFLPYLQRQKSHKAQIEAVFSGSRFKVRFAGENCSLVLALAACRSPACSSAARPDSETGGDEAKSFARRCLNQRVVDATVYDMDRNGVALGSLHVPGTSLATDGDYESRLLARGLAKLDRRRADQQAPGSELGLKYKKWADVEAEARASKLGLWADEANLAEFDKFEADKLAALESKRAEAESGGGSSGQNANAREATRWRGKIADIVDGASCFLHDLDAKVPGSATGATVYETVSAKMRNFQPGPAPTDGAAFKRSMVVASSFQGEWCRAKIMEHDKARTAFKLKYLDYGNVQEGTSFKNLRLLDPAVAGLPPAAVEAELAYVAVAKVDDDAGEAAASTLHELAWDQILIVDQHAPFWGSDKAAVKRVVLQLQDADPEDPSLNERLVQLGLARVPRAAKRDAAKTLDGPGLHEKLVALEQQARSQRLGLWRYGDVDYSDDER